jgi:hypothetical protein
MALVSCDLLERKQLINAKNRSADNAPSKEGDLLAASLENIKIINKFNKISYNSSQ